LFDTYARDHGGGVLRLALLDDHPATLDGLRALPALDPDHDLVSVLTASALGRRLRRFPAHAIVLAHRDGLAICRDLKDRGTVPPIIVVAHAAGPAFTLAAHAAGADGILSDGDSPHRMLARIRAIVAGDATLPGFRRDGYAAALDRLEDDDLPVLTMLLDGRPPAMIAAVLGVPAAALDVRVQRIVGRLQPVT
jgi:DNA-binding NarL/FixJ family response regulator